MAKSTIGMLVTFVVLLGAVIYVQKTQPEATEGATVYVLDVKDTDVQRMDLQTAAGTASFERADPLGWKFADSGQEADLSRVSSVVNRLAKLRSSSTVTDKVTDLPTYGLQPPVDSAVLVMKDGTNQRVLIGSKTPNDAAYYAMVDGHTDLHTINTLLVGDLEKLVTQPPVPSPTPGGATTTPTPSSTPGAETPESETPAVATPTVGLPAPSLGSE